MHRRQLVRLPLAGVALGLTAGWGGRAAAATPAGGGSRGLAHPWSLAFLPDGRLLVTERDGRLRLVERGRLVERPVEGVPEVVAGGQGGLLDVALDPAFTANGLIYLSYAGTTPQGAATHVLRARFDGARGCATAKSSWSAAPAAPAGISARAPRFRPDGLLHVSLGDRGDGARPGPRRPRRQDRPHRRRRRRATRQPVRRPRRCSAGDLRLRRAQGLAPDPRTGALWEQEHEARAAATRSTCCAPGPTMAGRW